MSQVVIQPVFGRPVARRNWKRTIDAGIGSAAPPYFAWHRTVMFRGRRTGTDEPAVPPQSKSQLVRDAED
jgi:hypothetical protein